MHDGCRSRVFRFDFVFIHKRSRDAQIGVVRELWSPEKIGFGGRGGDGVRWRELGTGVLAAAVAEGRVRVSGLVRWRELGTGAVAEGWVRASDLVLGEIRVWFFPSRNKRI